MGILELRGPDLPAGLPAKGAVPWLRPRPARHVYTGLELNPAGPERFCSVTVGWLGLHVPSSTSAVPSRQIQTSHSQHLLPALEGREAAPSALGSAAALAPLT